MANNYDDDFERLANEIMPCIEEHADGRNETTRARREAMLLHFDRYFRTCLPPQNCYS